MADAPTAELRRDPVVQRWVIISSSRSKRPTDFQSHGSLDRIRPGPCTFCPNHEQETGPETFAFRDGEEANAPDWRVRIVVNKFPALLTSEVTDHGSANGVGSLFGECRLAGFGSHEVVIETPDHCTTMAELPVPHISEVLKAYQERLKQFKKDPRYKYCQIFKNRGNRAGASMTHSHSQMLALPIITDNTKDELQGAKEYYDKHGKCIFCETLFYETTGHRSRVIDENSQYVSVAPYAPRFPYEIWLIPRRHASNYETIGGDEVEALAQILKLTLQKLDVAFLRPPYNYMIQTAPLKINDLAYYHWYVRIIPHLITLGGFELGSGCYINSVAPEAAAELLRNVKVDEPPPE